jgi:hypothetical protein
MRLKYGRTQVFDDYSAVMYNLNVNRDLERKENSDYSGVSDKCLLRKYLRNRSDFLYAAHLCAPITPAVGRLDCSGPCSKLGTFGPSQTNK